MKTIVQRILSFVATKKATPDPGDAADNPGVVASLKVERGSVRPICRVATGICLLGGMLVWVAADLPRGAAGRLGCIIDGQTNIFSQQMKAVHTAQNGMLIMGFGAKGASLALEIPVAARGTFSLAKTPGMRMDYSRSVFSSKLEDYFHAKESMGNSAFAVTIERCGGPGEPVAGTFWGILEAAGGARVTITNGFFAAVLEPANPNEAPGE